MFTADEIRRNVSGAWEVMKGDAGGIAQLDTSIEGFWRSFAVFFLVLPLFVLELFAEFRIFNEIGQTIGPNVTSYVFAKLVATGLQWVAFPAILAIAARPLRLDQYYVPFIVAGNWASLIIAAFYVPVFLLYVLGIVPTGLVRLAALIIMVAAAYFAFRIARVCLQVDGAMAAGIVAFNFVLALAISDLVPEPYPIPS